MRYHMTLVIPRDAKTSPRRGSLSLPSAEERRTTPSVSIAIPHSPIPSNPSGNYFPSAALFPRALFFLPPANSLSCSLPLSLSLPLPVWLVHRPPCIFPSCHPRPGLLQNIWTFCRQGFGIAFLLPLASTPYTKIDVFCPPPTHLYFNALFFVYQARLLLFFFFFLFPPSLLFLACRVCLFTHSRCILSQTLLLGLIPPRPPYGRVRVSTSLMN